VKILSQRIKSRRIEKNMHQKKLAELIGVKESTISSYETDNSSPDPEKLRKIALALGTSSDYLLGLSEEKVGTTPTDDIKVIIEEIENKQLTIDDINYLVKLKKSFTSLPDLEIIEKIKSTLNMSVEDFIKLKESEISKLNEKNK
jgi:transcriptional regulator with XRE-family HTH domain